MVRSLGALLVLALLGLFGYYYVNDSSGRSGADKAKDALSHVGDKVLDSSIAGLVHARILSTFGVETARYLHVWQDEGRVLIYGLAPPSATPEAIAADVKHVPGVKEVEVSVLPRPAYLNPTVDAPPKKS